MSHISFRLLPEKNRKILQIVSRILGPNACLSGGTALMAYLRHRRSYDLDFFFSKSLPVNYLEKKLSNGLGKELRLLYTSSDQINAEWQKVRISLVYFPFKPVGKSIRYGVVNVRSLRDIASEKAYAIGRREEWRDYADLYAILKSGALLLEQIIKDCDKRFKDAFSSRLFLNQLSSVEQIQPYSLDWIWQDITPRKICNFFKKILSDYIEISSLNKA